MIHHLKETELIHGITCIKNTVTFEHTFTIILSLVGQDILIISIIKFILTASSNLIQDNSNFIASFALSLRALATFWVTIQRMSAKEAATIHFVFTFCQFPSIDFIVEGSHAHHVPSQNQCLALARLEQGSFAEGLQLLGRLAHTTLGSLNI